MAPWSSCKPWPPALNVTVTDSDLDQNPLVVEKISQLVTMYKYGSEELEVLNITETGLDSISFTANLQMLKTSVPDCGCGSCAPCINPSCCALPKDGIMFANEGDVLQAVYKDASPAGYRIWSQRAGSVGVLTFQTVDVSGALTPCSCFCDGLRACSCSAPVIVGGEFNLLLTDADVSASQPPAVAIKCFRSGGVGAATDSESVTLIPTGQPGQFTGTLKSISSNVAFTPNNGKQLNIASQSFQSQLIFNLLVNL